MRTVSLGGQARGRGLLGGDRNSLENLGLGVVVVTVVVVALSYNDVRGLLLCGGLLLIGLQLFTPRPMWGGSSPAGLLVRRWRWAWRSRRGLTTFVSGEPARSRRGRATTKEREVPDWVGRVRPVPVRTSTGGSVLVLLHAGVGNQPGYATLVLEVQAKGGGIQSQSTIDREYARFGRVKAALARDDSLVRVIQQVERVQPASLMAHEAWLVEKVPAGVNERLVSSYTDLLRGAKATGEWHRSLLVLRMPFTHAWNERVAERFEVHDYAARAQMAVLEAQRVARIALLEGGYTKVTPLGEDRLAAVIRSCLNPDYSWTDIRPTTIRNCWESYEASTRSVVVAGKWHTRTARIQGRDLPVGAMPVTFLRRLVVGIYPSVIRTMTITEELKPAWVARKAARADVTQDLASVKARRQTVSDGSEVDQVSSSQQRLRDLAPGHGSAGVGFSIHITVAGEGKRGLARAVERLESAANDMEMPVTWMDREQDLALGTTLPLGRGLATSTKRRTWG